MMFDLLVARLRFVLIPNTFHDNEDSTLFQRGPDMAQHSLMSGHLVVGVDDQCPIKRIGR